ncbi:MAG TPA: hypothetical protein VL987_12220 [Cellvibrio sp.]|nr:hypothetical protein [Cellvibrio sp.]
MEVRNSPYNSPFIPYGEKGVYWLGKEHQHGHHNEHVKEFCNSNSLWSDLYLGRITAANAKHGFSDSEYAELHNLYFKFGIQAAGRRLGLA